VKVFKFKEVQATLKISKPTLLKILKSGDLKGTLVGGQWRITEIDLNKYMGVE